MLEIKLTKSQAYNIHTILVRASLDAVETRSQKDVDEAMTALNDFQYACQMVDYDPNHLEA